MPDSRFLPYSLPQRTDEEMLRRGDEFLRLMSDRRSVRHFSDRPVPRKLIEVAIETASTAPSGAHRQPWKYVAVSDQETKHRIRVAAEAEERENYEGGRMPPRWREAVAPFGTDWHKPYLETAPWLVVLFEETWGVDTEGRTVPNYYVRESVGISCGFFLAALHHIGLAALTHTPSPMAFLSEILNRPPNEKPYVLIPVGYPAPDATVPALTRKPLNEVAVWDPLPGPQPPSA